MNQLEYTTAQNRAVAIWLLICCGLVFAMVVLGGFTRLTGSGLSMVDWRPMMGWLPPFSDAEWQRVFDMYRQSPEFLHVNSHMDVTAFKEIFWLEFLHRLLGRTIGIVFLLPFIFFLAAGYIKRVEWAKYLLMFVLGGMQGVLGLVHGQKRASRRTACQSVPTHRAPHRGVHYLRIYVLGRHVAPCSLPSAAKNTHGSAPQ